MIVLLTCLLVVQSSDVQVRNAAEFRDAASRAKQGTRILLAPGDYPGGFHFTNLRGTHSAPIVIAAADPSKPPRFVGGGNAIQLSGCSYLELRDLVATGQTGNGFNIDDGGNLEAPTAGIVLRNLKISDLPRGNHDGIKLSGLESFQVENCTVERWGGSAIDMVGCRKGRIVGCTFRNGGDNAVQCKGGTSDVSVDQSRFENYGERGVNIGGSTGMAFFRPPIEKMPPNERYEAKRISVSRCTFSGGTTPFAFVGVDGASVTFNTVYNPGRWALRILQETNAPGFVPSRKGMFKHNLVVFRSDRWSSGGVNVGGNTAPETFQFANNFWYCMDRPERSRPSLPTPGENETVGVDPQLRDPEKGDFGVKAGSPAISVGAHAKPQ